MRLTTTRLIAVPIVMLVLAGCGGTQVTVNDVPGGPVDLTVPGTAEGLAPVSASVTPTATATGTPGADTAATPTPQADTGATTDNTAPADPNGGAQAPATDTTTTDKPPQPGAPADEFEDYCAQNPGAC